VRWEDIIEIRYGKLRDRKGETEYVQYISKNQSYVEPIFPKDGAFKNNYYEHLVEMLKKKCPQARWVRKDLMGKLK
jgi:hypothetical protein